MLKIRKTPITDTNVTYPEKCQGIDLGNDGVSIAQDNSLVINSQRITPKSLQAHASSGQSLPEATIKTKHFRREELILMAKHMFLATVADGQTDAPWAKGRKTANTHLESAFPCKP